MSYKLYRSRFIDSRLKQTSYQTEKRTGKYVTYTRHTKTWRGNPGRFDMVEGLGAEIEGQIDLKEIDILPGGDSEF
jgi:hypothetical protein